MTKPDVSSVWDDLPVRLFVGEQANCPTQKSERLAERLIRMGSNEGDLVLDPFCGSGTTLLAATRTGRTWIGGDNSTEAIALATRRLKSECGLAPGGGFVPTTEEELKAQLKAEILPRLRIATGFEDLVVDSVGHLVFGLPLDIEETREYEFKEVTGKSPCDGPRMARELRVEYPGAISHVLNRGDRREPMFKDDADRRRFVETLTDACAKTGW